MRRPALLAAMLGGLGGLGSLGLVVRRRRTGRADRDVWNLATESPPADPRSEYAPGQEAAPPDLR